MLLNQNKVLVKIALFKKAGKSSKEFAKYLNNINILPMPSNKMTVETLREHVEAENKVKKRLLNAYNKTTIIKLW